VQRIQWRAGGLEVGCAQEIKGQDGVGWLQVTWGRKKCEGKGGPAGPKHVRKRKMA
jgi:hypothetical protein